MKSIFGNMNKLYFLFLFFAFSCTSENKQAELEPYGAVPSERQLNWHDIEVYGLIHFTPTTFENKEWGFGDAAPSIFNPTDFDADQIVEAAKAGGLKALILVAKHHDGFCLWPTKTTEYNITKSPWRDGNGDLVKEMEQACRKAGLQFGVYCSPWDRNSEYYGTDKYLEIYREQLRELYTNYGDLFISWHDGANGGDGYYGGANEMRKIDNTTYYHWDETWNNITRELQPGANIFSDIGLDVRWVGGEHGYAAEIHWATFTPEPNTGGKPVPGNVNTMVSSTGTRGGKYWMPAECDVPLRPGWFYHPEEDGKEKSAEDVFELYLKSVGRGAGLDLGLAPTTEGKLHENDVAILKKFGEMVKETFADNLAADAQIGNGNAGSFLTDNDKTTYWTPGENEAVIDIELNEEKNIKYVQLREYIPLGQRLTNCKVEALINGEWSVLNEVKSIGANRIMPVNETVSTKNVRISLTADAPIVLSEIGLF
jgi:alpha-L-fucosidase